MSGHLAPAAENKIFAADLSAYDLPCRIELYSNKQWHNPPVSQGNTNTCRCFSITSFLEINPLQYLNDILRIYPDYYADILSYKQEPFYEQVEYTVPDNWWFLIKDSGSGSRNNDPVAPEFGYYFFSEDCVKLKMMDFTVHKDGVRDLLTKFK